MIVMENDKVLNHTDPPDGLKDQLINAGIVAGFNFFSTLAGLSITGITENPVTALAAAAISAGLGFFASLMTQRGLHKPEVE